MKRFLLLCLILFLCSCRSLPKIQHVDTALEPSNHKMCSAPFIEGNWQFIHSIEATLPNQKKTVVMGITNISSEKREIKVVMMTIEGLVIFDAEYKNNLKINKAISPFDSEEFAARMLDDIRLIFFVPEGRLEQKGYGGNGSRVCRYRNNDGVVDIDFILNERCKIIKYNNYNEIDKVVHISSYKKKNGKTDISHKISLTAYGRHKYSLRLDLIESNKIAK